jgi:ribonuclease P protein component
MDEQPRKVSRLKRSGEFRRVREAGVSFAGKWLVFGVWKAAPPPAERLGEVRGVASASEAVSSGPAQLEPPRFGVVTSRKVGGAVIRNKVRRRIRHIQQKHLAEIRGGVWCVTVARFRAAEATFAELDAEWCKLARRAGILCA